MTGKMTFWELLAEKNQISIPAIQRDYVQGRLDLKTTHIREKFIEALFDALQDPQKKLDLHFVYGSTDCALAQFAPIDGQQRLTMLFLLHWYLAVSCGRIGEPEVRKRLLNFQYATRFTTAIFCRYLIESGEGIFAQLDHFAQEQFSDKYTWFAQFGADLSVRSMLVVLQTIHRYVKKKAFSRDDLEKMWHALTANQKIYFNCLDIEKDLSQTDSIYIKMNARGKQLTSFEIFKSELLSFLKYSDFVTDFIGKLNGKWTQFFWCPQYRNTLKSQKDASVVQEIQEAGKTVYKEGTVDSQMMRFFRFWLLMEYIIHFDPVEENKDVPAADAKKMFENQNSDFKSKNTRRDLFERFFKLESVPDYLFVDYLFGETADSGYNAFQQMNVNGIQANLKTAPITEDSFKRLYILLDVLSCRRREQASCAPLSFIGESNQNEWNKEYIRGGEEQAFLRLIGVGHEPLSAEDKLLLFAEYAFLIKYASKKETSYFFDTVRYGKALQEWLRLIHNLIHYYILNDEKTWDYLFDRIRAIYSLLEELPSSLPADMQEFRLKLCEGLTDKPSFCFDGFLGFSPYQREEERIKYQLMRQSEPWRKKILATEKDTYLGSSMAALFEFAGITESSLKNADQNMQNRMYDRFCSYLETLSLLLSKAFLEDDPNERFRRALLCYGGERSYLIANSFLAWDKRDPFSFKRLLRKDSDRSAQRECVQKVIDHLPRKNNQSWPADKEAMRQLIEEGLEQLIADKRIELNAGNGNVAEKWKKVFLENPVLIHDVGAAGIYVKPRRCIYKKDACDILLISKDSIHSINREVYSYVLWYKLHANYAQEITLKLSKPEKEVFGYESSIGARAVYFKNAAASVSYIGYEKKYLWYRLADQTEIHVHYAQKEESKEWQFIAIKPCGNEWEFKHQTDTAEEMLRLIKADLLPVVPSCP